MGGAPAAFKSRLRGLLSKSFGHWHGMFWNLDNSRTTGLVGLSFSCVASTTDQHLVPLLKFICGPCFDPAKHDYRGYVSSRRGSAVPRPRPRQWPGRKSPRQGAITRLRKVSPCLRRWPAHPSSDERGRRSLGTRGTATRVRSPEASSRLRGFRVGGGWDWAAVRRHVVTAGRRWRWARGWLVVVDFGLYYQHSGSDVFFFS